MSCLQRVVCQIKNFNNHPQVLAATAEVLAELLQEPVFKELRTNQQLGYIVFSGLRSVDGVASLVVIVQSSQVPLDPSSVCAL